MSEQLLTEVALETLDLEPPLQRGIESAGFRRCTPIQAQALPMMLDGKDVAGQAQTGTGKTAAFLLAGMNVLLRGPEPPGDLRDQPRFIVIAPTRELAVQIHKDATVLGGFTGLRMGVVFGGTGYDSQRDMLRDGLDILIGTPGRLIDYFKQRVFNLRNISVVVIDEADRMFDLGFIRDIRYLLRRMPPPTERLNMLFSATLSYRVQELAYEHMNAPRLVDASPPDQVTVDEVSQRLYHVSKDEKPALLVGVLRSIDPTRTLIFANTKRACETLDAVLEGNGFHAGMLSGDVPQKQRLQLLEQFSNGTLPVLVATDVAARGLHIPDVSHVVNFDLPQDAEDYVHRIGRTARAGKRGDAVSFACEEYVFSLPEIEEFIGRKIPAEQPPAELFADLAPPARRRRRSGTRRGGPGGPRGGRKGGDRGRRKGGDRGRRHERPASSTPR